MKTLPQLLRANHYPGRGIVLGRDRGGTKAILVYFIMGRSDSSRNRVFVPTEDGIRTEAYDPKAMKDPSLLIYHPVRLASGHLVVTNGNQTDTIRDGLKVGKTFQQALASRTFEPDSPHYTPRISGMASPDGSYQLSILKTNEGDPGCCVRCFYTYDTPLGGEGRFLHTYQGDGNPLPSFVGEPVRVKLDAPDAKTLADELWDALNRENKVSLFVRYWTLSGGKCDDAIRNRWGK